MEEYKRPTLKHVDNFLNKAWADGRLEAMIEGGEPGEDFREGLKAQWAAETARFDEILTDGEGTIPEHTPNQSVGGLESGIYKWVRIYQGSETRKAIGTFYLHYELDEPDLLAEMWLARVRKGLPPNPSDKSLRNHNFIPQHVNFDITPEMAAALGEADNELLKYISDDLGSQGVRGLRATTRVQMEQRDNHDHVWVLDGYRVRSTKLAPVLHAFRRAGIQRIPLDMIRKAVQAL